MAKLLEYHGKEILRKFGIPVPAGRVVRDVEDARQAAVEIGYAVVVKAQVYAGKRGISGGIRIAADDVRMGIPPVKLGLVYHQEGLRQVVEAIGMARAREVFFTGRLYSAEDVKRMGLVHQMVPQAELKDTVYSLAEEIAHLFIERQSLLKEAPRAIVVRAH